MWTHSTASAVDAAVQVLPLTRLLVCVASFSFSSVSLCFTWPTWSTSGPLPPRPHIEQQLVIIHQVVWQLTVLSHSECECESAGFKVTTAPRRDMNYSRASISQPCTPLHNKLSWNYKHRQPCLSLSSDEPAIRFQLLMPNLLNKLSLCGVYQLEDNRAERSFRESLSPPTTYS